MQVSTSCVINHSKIRLLDLPNELLLNIFKRLSNMDVLYSLNGTSNERLNLLVQSEIFTNTLNFVSNDADTICSVNDSILDRFCLNILPQIQHNVCYLIVEITTMDHILSAGEYPNLIKLKIFNLNEDFLSRYLTHESKIGQILKKQITDLTIRTTEICKNEIYATILRFFEKLTDFHVDHSFHIACPILSVRDQPSTTFFSSILTKLSILAECLEDCFALLDGRLKQLSSLTITVFGRNNVDSPMPSFDYPFNLKSFSLTYHQCMDEYGTHIVPLLRPMNKLEQLTLHIYIGGGKKLIDGNDIHQDILIHMPRLQSFVFHIQSSCKPNILGENFTNKDIEKTFINIGYEEVICLTRSDMDIFMLCNVFSVPYAFDFLHMFGKNFDKMIFPNVTRLHLWESTPFEYEFFFRLAQSFPVLRTLLIHNWDHDRNRLKEDLPSNSFVEFPCLSILDVAGAHIIYIEQLLHYSTTRLPRLTKLKIQYEDLKMVTNDFTRDATRINCSKIQILNFFETIEHSDDFTRYFPSLDISLVF